MTPDEAIDRLAQWGEPLRRRTFDVVCLVRHQGETYDTWPDAAAALLDLCGYLDECECDRDLERCLREANDLYFESGIVDSESIKARAVELLNDAIRAEA